MTAKSHQTDFADPAVIMVSVGVLADALDMTPRRVQQLVAEEVIPKADRGRYPLVAAVKAFVTHGKATPEIPAGDLDPAQERARKDRALAEQTEMKNAVTRGELVQKELIVLQIEREYSVVREHILGMKGKMSGVLTPQQAESMDDELREILFELSDADNFDEIRAAMDKQAQHRRPV